MSEKTGFIQEVQIHFLEDKSVEFVEGTGSILQNKYQYFVFFSSCTFILLYLIIASLFWTSLVQAEPVLISGESGKYELGPFLGVFEDTSKKLTIDQISSSKYSDQFIRNDSLAINQGITESCYWFRFELQAGKNIQASTGDLDYASGGKHWLLYLGKHLDYYDDIQVFRRVSGDKESWQHSKYGMYEAVANGVRDPLVIPILLPPADTGSVEVYLRVEAKSGFFLEPTLYTPLAYHVFSKKLAIFYGGYYGIAQPGFFCWPGFFLWGEGSFMT